jgi:hypothetical protein
MGPKISGRDTKSDRCVTKYITSKDNVAFKETTKAAELFQKQGYSNPKSLLS